MPSTDLASFDNRWYQPGQKWKIGLWFLVSNLAIHSYLPVPVKIKCLILRLFGAKIGPGVVIKPGVNIKYPWQLHVGAHAWIGEQVWIDNLAPVSIGAHACVSQGAMLLTGNHNFKKSSFDLILGAITLHEGVWIGAQATVCPGVVCGSHSVLTVGSVATKALAAYGIYQGNPAVLTKERTIIS